MNVLPRMKLRYCEHVMCRMCMQQINNAATSPVSVMPASWEVVCSWAHHPSYLPLLVSQTPSLGGDASRPPALLTQLSYPWKPHACRANNNYFLYILFYFLLMCMVLFSIVLYRTIVTVYSDNIFLYNYLRQMHQIIHLSPLWCFTTARGKSVQKNREVSGIKPT